MVRTYSTINASTSRIGELFDFVAKEGDNKARNDSAHFSALAFSSGRPVSDISLGPSSVDPNLARPNSVPLEPRTGWRPESKMQPMTMQEEAPRGEHVIGVTYQDYERQIREREREQRQLYRRDLQKQWEEQNERRLRTEISFGGHEFEKELLKQQRRQPSQSPVQYNGIGPSSSIESGSTNGFGYKPTGNGIDYDQYLRSAEIQNKRDYAVALLNQQQYDYRFGSRGYTPTFAAGSGSNSVPLSASIARRERSVPNSLHLLHNATAESITYGPMTSNHGLPPKRSDRPSSHNDQQEVYDPWGKGGAGAPIRDRDGRLVADRRFLQKSWITMLDTNLPHDTSQNRSGLASANSTPVFNRRSNESFSTSGPTANTLVSNSTHEKGPAPMNEKDFYKEELRKQIEEQKRLRELEREKQRLEDERDRLRIEREMEKQRREVEGEKRKQQEKADKAMRRAEIAQTNDNNHQGIKNGTKRTPPDDGLEWWERQPQTSLLPRSYSTNDISTKPLKPPSTPVGSGEKFDHHRSISTENHRSLINENRRSILSEDHGPLGNEDHKSIPSGTHRSVSIEHNRSIPSEHRSISTDHQRRSSADQRVASPFQSTIDNQQSRNWSATARNEQILRQLSAMRERLNKEQMRVRSAIRRREYSEELFDDDPESRNRSANAHHPRYHSNRAGLGRERLTMNEDEDPPLVKLIKNSKTFDTATLRRRPLLPNSFNDRTKTLRDDEKAQPADFRYAKDNGFDDHSLNSDDPDIVIDNFLIQKNAERRNRY